MQHDGTGNSCASSGLIMSPLASIPPATHWSTCSAAYLAQFLPTVTCLDNVPTQTFGARCGDGVIQAGEQCDCGGSDCSTIDPCCNGATCQFAPGAACSDLDGCCTSCQLAAAGHACSAATVCTATSLCDGVSPTCAAAPLPSGTACNDGMTATGGECFEGHCVSAAVQCAAFDASFGATLTPCTTPPAACGPLYCDVGGGVCAYFDGADGSPVLALDGTACGNGAQCSQGACSASSTLPACPGGVAANACGGCSSLPAAPGDACNGCGTYACAAETYLACSVTDPSTCPPVACTADAACAPGSWCDEYGRVPVPQLANGAPIPADPVHTNPPLAGVCTLATGALVCASGVCDRGDNACGYASSDGPCNAANGATVCRSGACSANGTCEPLGGCDVDADCSGGMWCSESAHACVAKLANGTTIPTDPTHASPVLNGACTTAASTLVCASGTCDVRDNACGLANADGPCTAANGAVVCRSGACGGSGTCEPAGGCDVDLDCATGLWCLESTNTCTATLPNGTALPTDPSHSSPTLSGACTPAAGALVCAAGVCDSTDNACGYANGDGSCTSANAATVCRSGACSVKGKCAAAAGCTSDTDCPSSEWCKESTKKCAAKLANGAAIPTDASHTNPTLGGVCTPPAATLVCASGVCDSSDDKCGYATGDGACTAVTAALVCRSGACSTDGVCEPAGGCEVDADCGGGTWCKQSAHKCVARLANGAGIPTDPTHANPVLNGACTAAAGALVCATGVCDAADGKCGYATGDGPCTVTTVSLCRSGACSADGACEPAGGCEVDADCTGGTWCKESAHKCVAKLRKGAALPNDPTHTAPTLGGVCTPAEAALVCESGACATTTNKCLS